MAKMTVDVDDKMMEKAIKDEIKRLEKRVKNLESSNTRLKDQIRKQKFKVEEAKRIVSIASAITSEFGDEWDE